MLGLDADRNAQDETPLDSEMLLSGHFWGELRVFLAVAIGKSFCRAAEMLNMGQPAVGRNVRRLQDLVGSQLVIPNNRGITLTPRGEALAHNLLKWDRDLFWLTRGLQTEAKEAEGIVRISVTEGLGAVFVAPSFLEFSAKYPKIQVHLKNPLNVRDFRANQTDMMLGAFATEASDILCSKIGCLHFIPVAAQDYINKHGVPTQSNLDQHFFLQSEHYCGKAGPWEPWNSAAARGRIASSADNSIAYAMLVKAGLGIGLLGSYTVLEPSVVPVDLGVRISVPLYAIAYAERIKARPVRLVFDWLSELFGNNPWFADQFRLDNPSSAYDAGFRKLFNLEKQEKADDHH